VVVGLDQLGQGPAFTFSITSVDTWMSKKIDTVIVGFQVVVGLDQLWQRPAFTFSITLVDTWIDQRRE
jgi:hypothetical protein